MDDIYNIEVKTQLIAILVCLHLPGKTLLIVNVASKCDTPQYEGLQKLYDDYKDRNFVVLGFHVINFGQEPELIKKLVNFAILTSQLLFQFFLR